MYKYDREGKPITDLMRWATLFEDETYKRVAKDTLPGGVVVSTVWLGIDHRFGGGGPPLIFETMIFEGENDQYQQRWSTEEEALAGHRKIVNDLKTGRKII